MVVQGPLDATAPSTTELLGFHDAEIFDTFLQRLEEGDPVLCARLLSWQTPHGRRASAYRLAEPPSEPLAPAVLVRGEDNQPRIETKPLASQNELAILQQVQNQIGIPALLPVVTDDERARLRACALSLGEPYCPDVEDVSRAEEFSYRPKKVSPAFRRMLLSRFPQLQPGTPFGDFSLRLLDYLLFPQFVEKGTERIVIPSRVVAELAKTPYNGRFCAREWLERFSREIVPLEMSDWSYTQGKARTVAVSWPAEIEQARQEEINSIGNSKRPRVYLDTGAIVSSRSQRRERAELQAVAQLRRDYAPPAGPLVIRLNAESEKAQRDLLLLNRVALLEAAQGMPQRTEAERRSRDWNLCRVEELLQHSVMLYKCVEKTCRVYACDTTIHQLSRELRHVALRGCISLDLKSAQLALAARYWNIQEVTDFLRQGPAGKSYWSELYTGLGLGAEHKPALKTATYALIFGGSLGNISQSLAQELTMDPEQAKLVAKNFFAHPLVHALSLARGAMKKKILADGGITDAFGRWIAAGNNAEARSAMAQHLQSYEVQLMSSVLPVLEEQPGVYIVSWLHDSLTLKCSDVRNEPRVTRKLVTALEQEANRLGVETSVETERL